MAKILPSTLGEALITLFLIGGAVKGTMELYRMFKGEDSPDEKVESVCEQRGDDKSFDTITLGTSEGVHAYQVLKGKSVFDDPRAAERIVNDLQTATMRLAMLHTSKAKYGSGDATPIEYDDTEGFKVGGKTFSPEELGYTKTGWRTALRLYRDHCSNIKAKWEKPQ